MTKLAKRFKRALASFLKDELMEHIGYNHNIHFRSLNDRFNVENIPFETMIMEVVIPIESNHSQMFTLEERIEDCKKQFAIQIMDHIHVDAQNLTNNDKFMRRSVRFSLRVQCKK